MKKALFTLVMLVGFIFNSEAQKVPMKFGKIDKANLAMTEYAKDTTAAAIILCDYGWSYFNYTDNAGFQLMFERHCRIKILDKNGLNWADVSIPLYNNSFGKEKIGVIKACTYNLENGKIVKEKLSSKAKFKEKTSDNWTSTKFTFPNVKEGSIIEFKYTITSDFPRYFRDWQFQYSIPVVWSEYLTEIPEYYQYNKRLKGYNQLTINNVKEGLGKIISTTKNRSKEFKAQPTTFSRETHTYDKTTTRMVMQDVPAFESEAYMTSTGNFISKIEYELAVRRLPGRLTENYTRTWEGVNKRYLDSESFGHQYKGKLLVAGTDYVNEEVEKIKANHAKPKARIIAAFEFVKNHMKWDGNHGEYVRKSLRKSYMEQTGNVGEINLILTLILQKLGFDAEPVLLSTRGNGIIPPTHPSSGIFNYVVACVSYGGSQFLLDATDPLHVVNMLPFKCLNGRGRLISKEKAGWVNLYTNKPKSTVSMHDLKISEDGIITGTSKNSRKNYAALAFRKSYESATNEEEFINEIEESNNGLEVISCKFENMTELYKPVKDSYEVIINDQIEMMGDMMFFTPLLYDQMEENPFKLENRTYPVDYGYKTEESNIYKFTIPEGYVVDEKPDGLAMTLPGDAAKYTYNISVVGNVIQIKSKFEINKTEFLPTDYPRLKKFYNQIIAKHAEKIVLKKKTI